MKLYKLLTLFLIIVSINSFAYERPNPEFNIKDPALKQCIIRFTGTKNPTKSDLISIKTLSCFDRRLRIQPLIKSFEGLEGWTQLKELVLFVEPSTDISVLSNFTNLESIHLFGDPNKYMEYVDENFNLNPLLDLPNLEILSLAYLNLTDVVKLEKLTTLEELYLNYNRISNISFLDKLTNLKIFEAKNNKIKYIKNIASLNLEKIDLSNNNIRSIPLYKKGTLKPMEFKEANFLGNPNDHCAYIQTEGSSKKCKITYYPYFAFYDNKLMECVKETIDLPDIYKISIEDFNKITTLKCPGKGITKLTGLEHWGQLKEIDMSDNNISDISPLRHLYNLNIINFRLNKISDLSALNYIRQLDKAFFEYNNISSLDSILYTGKKSWQNKQHSKLFVGDNDPAVCAPYAPIIFDSRYCD